MDNPHNNPDEDRAEVARRRLAAIDVGAWLSSDSVESVTSSLAELLGGLYRLDDLELEAVEPATTYHPVEE